MSKAKAKAKNPANNRDTVSIGKDCPAFPAFPAFPKMPDTSWPLLLRRNYATPDKCADCSRVEQVRVLQEATVKLHGQLDAAEQEVRIKSAEVEAEHVAWEAENIEASQLRHECAKKSAEVVRANRIATACGIVVILYMITVLAAAVICLVLR